MKVFISWSGENSRKIATALHNWLPYIIQLIKPFMSSEDIPKGERWSEDLVKQLEDTQFGIICLTRSNIGSPWLNFEAGALSKHISCSSIMPFLFHVEPKKLKGPLALFQSTTFMKEDIFNLLSSLNDKLEPGEGLDRKLLRDKFEKRWPDLEKELNSINKYESITGYDWLYTPSDIPSVQLDANCKSIWVVAPHVREVLQTTCKSEVVEENIKRGVKYRFILLRSQPNEKSAAREALWRIFEKYGARKDLLEIHPHDFKNQALTNYLILNPRLDDEQNPLRVFLELPVPERHHWIEVDKKAAYGFVDRFDQMCKRAGANIPH